MHGQRWGRAGAVLLLRLFLAAGRAREGCRCDAGELSILGCSSRLQHRRLARFSAGGECAWHRRQLALSATRPGRGMSQPVHVTDLPTVPLDCTRATGVERACPPATKRRTQARSGASGSGRRMDTMRLGWDPRSAVRVLAGPRRLWLLGVDRNDGVGRREIAAAVKVSGETARVLGQDGKRSSRTQPV